MVEGNTPRFSATELRRTGKVAPTRPEKPLQQDTLTLTRPDIEKAPHAPVDAVLILGMGPVEPTLVGKDGNRRVVIGDNHVRMRHNTLAALNIAASGLVKKDGLIIPSGTATADPREIQEAVRLKREHDARTEERSIDKTLSKLEVLMEDRKADMAPTPEEVAIIDKTTEAELMAGLFLDANAKSGKKGRDLAIEVFPDNFATETAENYIYAFNELDRRAREKSDGSNLFDGSLMVITSRYHIARTTEIAKYLGIEDQIVPLISQDVLEEYGYKGAMGGTTPLGKSGDEFDASPATRANEQKWCRTIHQFPEYFMPMLAQITDDQRLITTFTHAKNLYQQGGHGPQLEKLGLSDVSLDVATLREKLQGIQRVNPTIEPWMQEDVSEVNAAIEAHDEFTKAWLRQAA